MEKEQVAALGTIKEADMEAVMASEPDVIFIGGRLAKSYDALSEIAPVVSVHRYPAWNIGKCPKKCRDHCVHIWIGGAGRPAA